jgi:collagenase-like PrtC family protease
LTTHSTVVGDHTAVEVKARANLSAQDLKSLVALAEERKLKRYLCVSLEPRVRQISGVTVLPYREFLEALWEGKYR